MRYINSTAAFDDDHTTKTTSVQPSRTVDVMVLLATIIASVGIIANATVVIAFLNHRKLRGKIPNIFIINQVSTILQYIQQRHVRLKFMG